MYLVIDLLARVWDPHFFLEDISIFGEFLGLTPVVESTGDDDFCGIRIRPIRKIVSDRA